MLLINSQIEYLKKLCSTHNVETMYLFGSAVKGDFTTSSDIDLLVKFKPFDLTNYFENYLHLKEKLENLFGRKVDLVEEQTLKNPILIQSINHSKALIYG